MNKGLYRRKNIPQNHGRRTKRYSPMSAITRKKTITFQPDDEVAEGLEKAVRGISTAGRKMHGARTHIINVALREYFSRHGGASYGFREEETPKSE
jgi:hypothetical protein